jgi:shikimate kinase
MTRILLTGMSGTGKSTVIAELAARGYQAFDLDSDAYSEWVAVPADSDIPGTPVEPGRDWVWREDRVQALLTSDTPLLFVSGCASNMKKFRAQFTTVILLSAPSELILQRLANRTNNPYGKRPEEAARVLDLIQTVEPLLRKSANHEIDTSMPLKEVLARVLQLV